MQANRPIAHQAAARIEVLDRLASVRVVTSALLEGRWLAEPATLDALGELVASAASWSRRAAA